MGKLLNEYYTELEYLNEFDMQVESDYHKLILILFTEADSQDHTFYSLATLLKTSEYEIRNWIRDPEAITMKDLIKLEFLLNISILEIAKPDEEIPGV